MQKEAAAAVCSAASLFLFLHMDMKNTSQLSMVIRPIRIYHLADPAVVDLVANAPDPVLLAFRLLGDFPLCTEALMVTPSLTARIRSLLL